MTYTLGDSSTLNEFINWLKNNANTYEDNLTTTEDFKYGDKNVFIPETWEDDRSRLYLSSAGNTLLNYISSYSDTTRSKNYKVIFKNGSYIKASVDEPYIKPATNDDVDFPNSEDLDDFLSDIKILQ